MGTFKKCVIEALPDQIKALIIWVLRDSLSLRKQSHPPHMNRYAPFQFSEYQGDPKVSMYLIPLCSNKENDAWSSMNTGCQHGTSGLVLNGHALINRAQRLPPISCVTSDNSLHISNPQLRICRSTDGLNKMSGLSHPNALWLLDRLF